MAQFKVNKVLTKLVKILLTVILFFVLPIVIFVSIPIFILRWIIGKTAKFLHPTIEKILTIRSTVIAAGDNWKTAPKLNVIIELVFQGDLDVDTARKAFNERVLESKLPNGELLYPELKQVLTNFLGFYFWARDPFFKLDNHFRLCDKKCPGEKWSEEDLKNLREEKVMMPWNKKKPLWEILIINNYSYLGSKQEHKDATEKSHTVLLISLHHCLGDGYSWLNLLTKHLFSAKETFKNAVPDYKKVGIISSILTVLVLPFALPYFLAEIIIMSNMNLPWRLSAQQLIIGKMYQETTNRIPVSGIKEIKSHFKVNFSSVIFAILSGAYRDILIKKGSSLPSKMPCLSTFPLRGHPGKLRNFLTGVTLKLPIDEPDPVKRLLACSKDYENLKKSVQPKLLDILACFIGSQFHWFIKLVAFNQTATVGLTNFPGASNYGELCGQEVVDVSFVGGVVCAGISVCGMSYGDNMNIIPVADAEAMTKEELKEFTRLIAKHYDILYESVK